MNTIFINQETMSVCFILENQVNSSLTYPHEITENNYGLQQRPTLSLPPAQLSTSSQNLLSQPKSRNITEKVTLLESVHVLGKWLVTWNSSSWKMSRKLIWIQWEKLIIFSWRLPPGCFRVILYQCVCGVCTWVFSSSS